MLSGRDRIKLQNAGFTILRREEKRLLIKYSNENSEWAVLEKCKSKAELNQKMDRYLETNLFIEDK